MNAMSAIGLVKRQIHQMQHEGASAVLVRKMRLLLAMLPSLPLYLLAIPAVVVIRLIRPWLLVRIGRLMSSRIGHFAANTELYLCEQDAGINVPRQRYVDLFYMPSQPICNQQLGIMWKRKLRVWPAWILAPIDRINRLIAGGMIHEVGHNTQHDRDVHNLLDRFPPHLQFTSAEIARGEDVLRRMGIPVDASFVCLIVRDSAYLNAHQPGDWTHHNYRDSDVQNYVLAAEELADRGYFVIRMGAKVRESIKSDNPRVIDYAVNGMRSDFMDIYLGARCKFCISVSTGFDAVPYIFRRPIAYVNMVPLGYLFTFRSQFLGITKHHYCEGEERELSFTEIFRHGVGFSLYTSGYLSNGIRLIENTSEEIRDVVVEMAERLDGTWRAHEEDEALQSRFWEIFPVHAQAPGGNALHGEVRARFGANFLRRNQGWLR